MNHLDPSDGPPIVIVEAPDPTPPPIVINGCGNCGGPHHIQQCKEILDALFAPPQWDGQAIARAFHGNYNRFVATLLTLDVVTRAKWAVAYAAYISPFNKTGTPLTAEHVARIWNKALERTINFPPRAA